MLPLFYLLFLLVAVYMLCKKDIKREWSLAHMVSYTHILQKKIAWNTKNNCAHLYEIKQH